MHVFLLFLDGVGLGPDDAAVNPFARARMPRLEALIGGRLLAGEAPRAARRETARATLFATDACLGVPGRPQSATGQAVILTGRNVPAALGEHWGPKPDARVRAELQRDNLFMRVAARGGTLALLNAYPPQYFAAHESGRRLYSSVPVALQAAGVRQFTAEDLLAGRALSADFTGEGWRAQLGYRDAPVYAPHEAGQLAARLARGFTFSFFDGWVTDVLGHHQKMDEAVPWLERFDAVLGGLLDAWDHEHDLLVVTSDHGNLEDLSVRTHTLNLVPTILVGDARRRLAAPIRTLADIAPAVEALLFA